MARIETDPNYSSPTFPRATASTDLFLKEDVQGVAAAFSTHDHSTGKGLVISTVSLADGSLNGSKLTDATVTSAKILDGTIATIDIAADAVTRSAELSSAITSSSMSNTVVAIAGADVSLTTTGGPVVTWFRIPISHSAAGGIVSLYVHVDAIAWQTMGSMYAPTASGGEIVSGVQLWTGLSAGLHTWQLGWATGSGTMGNGGGGAITTHGAVELKR
jgi:hypothetical protein